MQSKLLLLSTFSMLLGQLALQAIAAALLYADATHSDVHLFTVWVVRLRALPQSWRIS